jgi:hypothetical protein
MNCLLGVLAIMVFEPMSVLPYFCRTIRIYTIFKAQNFYHREKKKPDTDSWFRWVKEPRMLKICAFWLCILAALSIISFVGFIFKQDVIEYMPSYTVYMCFMNGMCDNQDQ